MQLYLQDRGLNPKHKAVCNSTIWNSMYVNINIILKWDVHSGKDKYAAYNNPWNSTSGLKSVDGKGVLAPVLPKDGAFS